LEYARKLKELGSPVEKFLYFGTDEVYGSAPEGVFYSEGDRHNPGNPYSASKSAAESITRSYGNTYKIPCIITNTMNVIGERQDKEKYLPLVINKVLQGDKLFIHADPSKTKAGKRHYIHARNIAAALVFILENTSETLDPYNASSGVFNIVGEREFDNLEFALLIKDCVNKVRREQLDGDPDNIVDYEDLPLNYEMVDFHSARPGHDMRYALSGDKLLSMGFEYPVTVEESVLNIVRWTLKSENKRWLLD
jgi:dTDP-D-glucose 4,6-dehydratase